MPKIRPACDARYSDLRPDSGIVRTTTWGTGGISRLSSSLKLVKPSRARVISLLHAARRGQRGERSFLRWSPDFLRQVGIDQRLLAASIIEESLASNMLFYGAETRVTNVSDMVWCCFPFCFKRPT